MKKLTIKIVLILTISLGVALPIFANSSENVTVGNYLKTLSDFLGYEAQSAERGEHWAMPYAHIAFSRFWLLEYPKNLDDTITVYEASDLLLRALGITPNYWAQNNTYFADTNDEITYVMYNMGFYQGEVINKKVVFSPNSPVAYRDVEYILGNVNRYFEEDYMKTDFRYMKSTPSAPSRNGQLTLAYFESIFEYMLLNDIERYDIYYEGLSINRYLSNAESNMKQAYANVRDVLFPELGSFFDTYQYDILEENGRLTVTFFIYNVNFSRVDAVTYKAVFILTLEEILEEIINSGHFNMNWSQYEKAKYLYEWCAINYEYDHSLAPISFNGYGIIFNGVGVCQGYVSVFNSLCKMLGIEVEGAWGHVVNSSGNIENHIWSHVKLDERWVFVDPTWGDAGDHANFEYFAVSKRQLSKTHTFKSH